MSTKVEQLLARKTHHVWSLEPSATIREAVAIFGNQEIGAVLVCEGSTLVGLLTERDCVRNLLWRDHASLDTPLSRVMRTRPIAVSPQDSIEHCMSLINDHRTRYLPVVDQGWVVGMISIGDVINTLLREKESLIDALEGYISGSPSARPPAH
jgi:CBS domain-containing protein